MIKYIQIYQYPEQIYLQLLEESDIIFNKNASIRLSGYNAGGTSGEINKNSIAQYIADETGINVYAYLNNTSQKGYDINGNETKNLNEIVKYYQKPVRMTYGQKVVESYTKFTPTPKEYGPVKPDYNPQELRPISVN